MKILCALLIIMLLPTLIFAQNYQIDWYVIGSGGGTSSSPNYQLSGTIGQPIVGTSSSANYTLEAGFWVGAAPAGGCGYLPGDINNNGFANGIDVVYGVAYLKGGNPPPVDCNPPCTGQPDPFFAAMDVNGNCAANGIDITYFVAYLKGVQPSLLFCAACPPGGMAAPGPAVMPIKDKMPVIEPAIRPVLNPGGAGETSD